MLSATFFFKVQFLLQLLVGEALFLCRLERKEGFWCRLVPCAGVLVLLCGLVAGVPAGTDPLSASAPYLLLFGCSLTAVRLCFAEPFQNLLFCGIGGYTVQHLAHLLFAVTNETAFSGVDQLGLPVVDPYSATEVTFTALNPVQLLLYIGIYVLCYGCIYFVVYLTVFDLFDPVICANHDLRLGRSNLIWLSGLLIAADVIFNMVTTLYTQEGSVSRLLEFSYNILLCLTILALLYGQLSQRALKDELLGVQYVLEQGKRQYELAKETSELLNIKYHDLRHQSALLERRGTVAEGEREELNRLLGDYDRQVQTGNEVLDVILTEKNVLCRNSHIQLLCMADGRGLDFVKPHHLYAILSNAIENAMEAVEPLPEEERVINLYLRRTGNFVHIQVENLCGRPVQLRGGLPVTHKEDANYHGFGMLSMKTIAEQYGGGLSVRVEDGVFSLDIVLSAEGD